MVVSEQTLGVPQDTISLLKETHQLYFASFFPIVASVADTGITAGITWASHAGPAASMHVSWPQAGCCRVPNGRG